MKFLVGNIKLIGFLVNSRQLLFLGNTVTYQLLKPGSIFVSVLRQQYNHLINGKLV